MSDDLDRIAHDLSETVEGAHPKLPVTIRSGIPMSDDHEDPFLDLRERFAARGVQLRFGNTTDDMIRHLLDVVEEQDVRLRGLEDGYRKLRLAGREADDKDSY